MTKKPTKPGRVPHTVELEQTVKKLRAENKALRKRVAELESATAAPMIDNSEVVTVQVGPLMPWETALPNSFKVT